MSPSQFLVLVLVAVLVAPMQSFIPLFKTGKRLATTNIYTSTMEPSAATTATAGTTIKAPIDPVVKWGYTPTPETDNVEHLIGEEMVSDDESASKLADRCMAEAYRLFNSQANWKRVEVSSKDIKVEVIPLSGDYGKSGVDIVRGSGIIPASADDFYNFQISREGFQSIDEYLVNHRNVKNFKWTTQPEFAATEVPEAGGYFSEDSPYQLMMNRVEWKYPVKRREFVALDVVHKEERILISKSSLSPLRPGGSRYQNIVPLDENTPYVDPVDPVKRPLVRAVQYYASKVDPIDDKSCRLTMVTWGEMCDNYSAWWVNMFNAHVFITPKFDRFRRVMGGERVWEESKIMDNAWQLIKIIPFLKPDSQGASASDFVTGKKVV